MYICCCHICDIRRKNILYWDINRVIHTKKRFVSQIDMELRKFFLFWKKSLHPSANYGKLNARYFWKDDIPWKSPFAFFCVSSWRLPFFPAAEKKSRLHRKTLRNPRLRRCTPRRTAIPPTQPARAVIWALPKQSRLLHPAAPGNWPRVFCRCFMIWRCRSIRLRLRMRAPTFLCLCPNSNASSTAV